jgi:type I restriction enzyme, S subunit
VKNYSVIDLLDEVVSGEWGQEPNGNNDVKVIRTTNFSNDGRLNLEKEVVYRNIDEKKVEKKKLRYGDIIIEKSGGSPDQPVGRVVYYDIKDDDTYLCNNFTSVLRPDTSKVLGRYLFYFLFYQHKIRTVLKYQNKTTGIINLKLDNYIKKTEIKLPDFETQKKIVKFLDISRELIDKRKSQIDSLDQLTQSVFLEMFGDPVKNTNGYSIEKLSSLCEKITDGTHHSPPSTEDGVPYITAKHLRKDGLDFYSNPTYVSEKEHKKIYARCNPVKGDVLYIKDGATTGIAGINKYEFEFSMLSSLALIKPNQSRINSYYLVYYLNNKGVLNRIINNMSGGAIKRLTLKKINNIEVNTPPIDLQDKFSEFVKNIEEQKSILKQGEMLLENNYKSTMQRAFKGELFTQEELPNA